MVSKIHGVIMVKRPASVRSTTLSLRLLHDSLLSVFAVMNTVFRFK